MGWRRIDIFRTFFTLAYFWMGGGQVDIHGREKHKMSGEYEAPQAEDAQLG